VRHRHRDRIQQFRADISDYRYVPTPRYDFYDKQTPKYHKEDGTWNPVQQIDTAEAIPSTQDGGYHGQPTYDEKGY
jgi:hypothetical protein